MSESAWGSADSCRPAASRWSSKSPNTWLRWRSSIPMCVVETIRPANHIMLPERVATVATVARSKKLFRFRNCTIATKPCSIGCSSTTSSSLHRWSTLQRWGGSASSLETDFGGLAVCTSAQRTRASLPQVGLPSTWSRCRSGACHASHLTRGVWVGAWCH